MTDLRAEIELRRAGDRALLFDPMRHRYFAVPAPHSTDADGVFAKQNELAIAADDAALQRLAARSSNARQNWWQAVMHRYLFLRIPLVRPDRFLEAMLPLARSLMGRAAVVALVFLGLAAALLVWRRIDEFALDFAQLMTWDGVLLYVVAIAILKTLHELGHAFALKARGGSVPSMGVAFVVLFPILYTDTSDAWLLPRRRDRLAVDLAGIGAELAVAVLATWVWIVLPEGAGRSVAFSLAAVSWTLSLAVNLNPFMRFDGYHVLADWLDLPNLQERAFALARWRMREILFAPGGGPPEEFAPRRRRLLVAYAWTTWAYRLVLFTGIALLVYQATFKALGIILFAIEMIWFVGRPVAREMRAWLPFVRWRRPRSWLPFGLTAALVVILTVPLDRSVTLPAVLEVGHVEKLRAPHAGRIRLATRRDGPVRRGDVIAQFDRAEDAFDLRKLNVRLAANRPAAARDPNRLRHRIADQRERELLVEARRQSVSGTLQGIVIAPRKGELRLRRGLGFGRDFSMGEMFGTLVSDGTAGKALADVATRRRLDGPSVGTFVPDVDGGAIAVRLDRPSDLPVPSMRPPELALRHGGSVVGLEDAWRLPHFAISLHPMDEVRLPYGRWRGVVNVAVPPRSYGEIIIRRLHSVWVRETGF